MSENPKISEVVHLRHICRFGWEIVTTEIQPTKILVYRNSEYKGSINDSAQGVVIQGPPYQTTVKFE